MKCNQNADLDTDDVPHKEPRKHQRNGKTKSPDSHPTLVMMASAYRGYKLDGVKGTRKSVVWRWPLLSADSEAFPPVTPTSNQNVCFQIVSGSAHAPAAATPAWLVPLRDDSGAGAHPHHLPKSWRYISKESTTHQFAGSLKRRQPSPLQKLASRPDR